MEIERLVLESRKGSIDSFIKLLMEKQDTFYRIAYTYTQNPYDAEDSISEASIKAFDKIHQLKNAHKFYSWYISILVNVCKNKYRFSKREVEYSDIVLEQMILKRENFEDDRVENEILVAKILDSLKKDERNILILKYLKDFSLQEISEILEIPEGTVKSKLYRTINKIKRKYGRVLSEG